MSVASQFGGGLPLGATIQGIGLSEPQWVRCDGRTLTRSSYQRLSTLFPIGKLTGTARTIATPGSSFFAAASPTYFIAPNGSGSSTSAIQYSTDGITWSSASVVNLNAQFVGGIWAGTRFVVISGTTTNAHVTTGDNPNSTWTATTGGPVSVTENPQGKLAYSPSLGRVVGLPGSGPSTSVFTLDNGATAWTSRTATSATRRGVCWTGSRFIAAINTTPQVSTSSDGITWVESRIPETPTAAQVCIASNGAGAVVMSGFTSGLVVSLDHGITWISASVPGVTASDTWSVSYVGDRFMIPTATGLLMSLDGINWAVEYQPVQAFTASSAFAKKGATTLQVQGSTAAFTFTESATDFASPYLRGTTPYFIKAL